MSSLAVAHTLSLIQKSFPYGIPKKYIQKKRVVFFLKTAPTVAEQELIMSAAVKGLRLLPDQFAVEIGIRKNACDFLIVCGESKDIDVTTTPARKVFFTFSAEAIVQDANKKKEFWETIKPILTL